MIKNINTNFTLQINFKVLNKSSVTHLRSEKTTAGEWNLSTLREKQKSFSVSSFYEERDKSLDNEPRSSSCTGKQSTRTSSTVCHRPKTYFNSHCQVKCTTETVRQL